MQIILKIGAGTGRYSIALAKEGHEADGERGGASC